jgi:hypothetical protein
VTNRRGFGWKPDKVAIPKLRSGALKLIPVEQCPETAHYADKVIVTDQETSSTCVAHCASMIWRVREWIERVIAANGGTFEVPDAASILWLYERCCARDGEPGIDDGTRMATVFAVMRELGFPTEKHWPWDIKKLFKPVPDSVAYHAHDQIGSVAEYGLYQPSKSKLKQLLASGYPIAAAAYIDTPYADCWNKQSLEDAVLDLDGPREGGHAIGIIGYNSIGLIHAGTWGKDFGHKGFAIISWEGTSRLRDMRAISGVRGATS